MWYVNNSMQTHNFVQKTWIVRFLLWGIIKHPYHPAPPYLTDAPESSPGIFSGQSEPRTAGVWAPSSLSSSRRRTSWQWIQAASHTRRALGLEHACALTSWKCSGENSSNLCRWAWRQAQLSSSGEPQYLSWSKNRLQSLATAEAWERRSISSWFLGGFLALYGLKKVQTPKEILFWDQ